MSSGLLYYRVAQHTWNEDCWLWRWHHWEYFRVQPRGAHLENLHWSKPNLICWQFWSRMKMRLGFFHWNKTQVRAWNVFLSNVILFYVQMVFCLQIVLTNWEKNGSRDREKLLKFETEGQEFAKFLRSQEQFIQTVKGQNNFWKQNAFLTCSWRILISKKIEQL